MRIKRFQIEDLDLLDDKSGHLRLSDDTVPYQYGESGISVTYLDEDSNIIGATGFVEITDNTLQCWAVFTDLLPKYLKSVVQHLKMENEIMSKHYHRIQAQVLHDFEEGHKFIKSLGFYEEALIKKMDVDGNDYMQYAIIN